MITKIVLLLLLLVAVLFGGRVLARLGQASPRQGNRRESRREKQASATQLEECPRCGAYVPGGPLQLRRKQ